MLLSYLIWSVTGGCALFNLGVLFAVPSLLWMWLRRIVFLLALYSTTFISLLYMLYVLCCGLSTLRPTDSLAGS